MLVPVTVILWIGCMVDAEVLDPSLYLSPSPPLRPTSNDLTPEELWSTSLAERVEREANRLSAQDPLPPVTETIQQETIPPKKKSWFSNGADEIRSLQIPITFAISGDYGRYGSNRPSVIGSSYGTVSGEGLYGNYGKSAWAGSSYGSYAPAKSSVRIFGNSGGPAWSGWGNGKWGHYGQG